MGQSSKWSIVRQFEGGVVMIIDTVLIASFLLIGALWWVIKGDDDV